MTSLVKRGLLRAVLHLARFFLLPIEVVRPRLYMRLYLPLLAMSGVVFKGTPRYISSRARFDDLHLVELGDRAVLSRNVILLTHDYSLTTALRSLGDELPTDLGIRRSIRIGNNVFVGMNAVLLPGTVIEDDVIIGAGSVVRGRIESDSIVIGNPGTVVGTISARETRWREYAASDLARADHD